MNEREISKDRVWAEIFPDIEDVSRCAAKAIRRRGIS